MAAHERQVDPRSGFGRWAALRVLAAMAPIVLLVVAVRATGVMNEAPVEELRSLLARMGPWQIPLFVLVYGLGILAHVPGSIFVAAGVLVFGPAWGFLWCYAGAFLGNLFSFGLVRLAGYRPLTRVRWPVVDRLFAQLTDRPTRTVGLIRVVFPTTAPVNYALALTDVSMIAYLAGSLIGVLPQLGACVWLFAFVFESHP